MIISRSAINHSNFILKVMIIKIKAKTTIPIVVANFIIDLCVVSATLSKSISNLNNVPVVRRERLETHQSQIIGKELAFVAMVHYHLLRVHLPYVLYKV